MKTNSPENSRFISNIERLSTVQSLPYFEHQETPDFRFFILGVLTRFAQAVENYEQRGGKAPRFVVSVVGLPGNGKSYLTEGINDTINNWGGPRLRQRLGADVEGWFAHQSWEGNGLKPVREAGLIVNPNEPASPEALVAANLLMQDSLARTIRSHLFTTVEAPIVGAVLADPSEVDISKKWRGRIMGNEPLRNLFTEKGPFQSIADEYDLQSFAAGVCGGKNLELFNDYRGEIKDAKTLREARAKLRKYGKPPIKDEEEFRRLQADGASPRQMNTINKVVWGLMQDLEKEGKIQMMTTDNFMHSYEEDVRARIGMNRPLSAFARYSTGILMRKIFEDDFELKMERYCIGYNDPSLEDLGIDKSRQAILKRFYTKMQMTRPPESLLV